MKMPELKLSEDLEKLERALTKMKELPVPTDAMKKELENKYRLEWNFNSNHIEGNTLTYGQTELLLFNGKATGDHEKQEYDEMEAHDLAIELIRERANEERKFTELDLRELNKILLVRPFWKEAITSDGLPTRKKIVPGEYKESPNSVRLKNGQIHDYASPEETPILMRELMDWYQSSEKVHPFVRACICHHEFTKIHPFDDGNGRVARLWLNFILLKAGYPPLIVRTNKKEEYLTSLEKADTGDLDAFIRFMIEEELWSIELSLKASRGEKLEEKDDINKRLALIESKLNSSIDEVSVEKSGSVIYEFILKSFLPIAGEIKSKTERIVSLFNKSQMSVIINGTNKLEYPTTVDFELASMMDDSEVESLNSLSFSFQLEGSKKGGFNLWLDMNIEFYQWFYEIKLRGSKSDLFKGHYHRQMTPNEIETISDQFVKEVIDQLEKAANNLK